MILWTYIIGDTFVPTYVSVVLYYPSQTRVIVQVVDAKTPPAKRAMSDAVIIGLVCGAAAILAILIGGIIFIVRKPGKSITIVSESDELEMAAMVTPGASGIGDQDTADEVTLTLGGDLGDNFATLNPEGFTADISEEGEHGLVTGSGDGEMWI
jgi:hypothetical protein